MFVHTVIMVIEPHMKQGRQHKLISTIFLATSVTKKLDHNIYHENGFEDWLCENYRLCISYNDGAVLMFERKFEEE